MTTVASQRFVPSYLLPAWKNETPEAARQKTASPAKEGWYSNSSTFEKNSIVSRQGSFGGDTSDLWKPSSSGSNTGYLANFLSKLPEWKKSGEFSVGAAAARLKGSFKSDYASGSGEVAFLEVGASGSGSISIKNGALNATGKLSAEANLIDAEGRIHLGKGDYTLDATGSAFVGAKANVQGDLTIDPKNGVYAAKVGGEAFVGARAGVEGALKLGKFGGAEGRAQVWAGAGIAFHGELGFKQGHFRARLDFGAALGIGFKLGFSININVKGIKDAITKPFKAIGDTVKNSLRKVTDTVKNVANNVADGVKNVAKKVGNFFKKLF